MELEQLKIFCAVANSNSFNSAAAELYISHSTVSRVVKRLEQELGAALFERTTRGVTLTDSGEALYEGATQLLDSAQALVESIKKEETHEE